VRAVCATVLAWATMVALTSAFDVADPVRITLFAAGAAFEGALLAPDPQPKDRVRTLGWASVVAAAAVVVTVALTPSAVWAAAVLLVLLMFSSYALRAWSPRVASLALMGAITVYITGAGYITVGRIGWFVLALVVGFSWLALWEAVILPDRPLRSLDSSVQAFSRRAADTVSGIVDALDTARDGTASADAEKAIRRNLDGARKCRRAIERQSPVAVVRGFGQNDADRLRVALHSAQKGLEDMAVQCVAPDWMRSLPGRVASPISSTLHALAVALRADVDEESRHTAVRTAQVLRGDTYEALTQTKAGEAPVSPDVVLATLTLLGAAEILGQSVTQAIDLASSVPASASAESSDSLTATRNDVSSSQSSHTLSPTMAVAIQAVIAPVAAGLIAMAVGNEQRLVVAWTAFVVIAGSAGLSARRAWVRVPATILGAVSGVAVAAFVPDNLFWTVAVVAVGVFFTIMSAPVSYPAMVFWMSIAFVPIFATEGRYLDLIWDKTVAAMIGGAVAAVVALTIVPIRTSRDIRPAVSTYLDALDDALAAHLPGREMSVTITQAELDRAHAALSATAASAATETNLFAQPERVTSPAAALVDAVHEAYLRLTPLLSDSSRRLHGWTDDRFEIGIRRLRDAVEDAKAAAPGRATSMIEARRLDEPGVTEWAGTTALELDDSLRRVEQLQATLLDLALVLDDDAVTSAHSRAGTFRTRQRPLRRG
jgi:hypothetical protein